MYIERTGENVSNQYPVAAAIPLLGRGRVIALAVLVKAVSDKVVVIDRCRRRRNSLNFCSTAPVTSATATVLADDHNSHH